MDNLLSEGDSSEEFDNNQILLDWIKAALNFHAQYKEVTRIIDEQKTKRYSQIKSNRLMGQCPLESLVMLKLTMLPNWKDLYAISINWGGFSNPHRSSTLTNLESIPSS